MTLDIYKPKFMLPMVEQMPPLPTFLKDTFFRNVQTFYTETVEFDISKGGQPMAPFVHPHIGATVLERGGYETMSYKPPLVAPLRILTTDDLDVRLPGEAVYSGYSPNRRRTELLTNDLIELDNSITRREEWMCAMALFNARIPVIGEGINTEITFDFDNTIVGLEGSTWDDFTNSRPIDDLENAADLVARSGYTADVAIATKKTINMLRRSKALKEGLDTRNYELGKIAPERLSNGAKYVGYLADAGLYIYSYDATYKDDINENPSYPGIKPGDKGFIPATYTMIPDGKVFVGSTSMPASMLYGVIKDVQIGSHAKPRVPKQWDQEMPSMRFVTMQSRPLPCPKDVDSWAILEVL